MGFSVDDQHFILI